MILSEVSNSDTLPREEFAVRSEEGYERVRCKAMKTNLHQGQPGHQSSGASESTLRDNYTRPAKSSLFCDYKGGLSGRSRVRGYQSGTGDVRDPTYAD